MAGSFSLPYPAKERETPLHRAHTYNTMKKRLDTYMLPVLPPEKKRVSTTTHKPTRTTTQAMGSNQTQDNQKHSDILLQASSEPLVAPKISAMHQIR